MDYTDSTVINLTGSLPPEYKRVYDRAFRDSIAMGLSGWDAHVSANRQLAAFIEWQEEEEQSC